MPITITINNEAILKKYSKQELQYMFNIFLTEEIQKEDWIPLTKDGKIELIEINYDDLSKDAKKEFDALQKGELELIEY